MAGKGIVLRNFAVRSLEDDGDTSHGRVFKKQRMLVQKYAKQVESSRTMTTHVAVHDWNECAGWNLGQKTFVTTCHFQQKRVPVRYTETMIVHLNSTKRRYYESVAYETKMVPSHWSQTMFFDLIPGRERVISEVNIPCDVYIPLIPQQVITSNLTEKIESSPKANAYNDTECLKEKVPNSAGQTYPLKVGTGEILDNYHRNTCEEFLNEMRKMY